MKLAFFISISILCQNLMALEIKGTGSVSLTSSSSQRVVSLFREVSRLIAPPSSTTASTTCGYIFPNDPNKFGCKGVGPAAAADVAAACAGGGELACTGTGSNRTCTCAFN